MWNVVKLTRCYLAAARAWNRRYPGTVTASDLLRFFGRWRRSMAPDRSGLKDEQAWITFAAIDYLNRIITPNSRIFEWGMGGSTAFFAKRAAEVVSVEHDSAWFQLVQNEMNNRGVTNWTGHFVAPTVEASGRPGDPSNCDLYLSSSPQYSDRSFRDYAAVIDQYADHSFDVIIVDGRARPSCTKHALNKLKPGGVIAVDNAERENYADSNRLIETRGLIRRRLDGPGPYNKYFWSTHIWQSSQKMD